MEKMGQKTRRQMNVKQEEVQLYRNSYSVIKYFNDRDRKYRKTTTKITSRKKLKKW